jgi:hypothetical protein
MFILKIIQYLLYINIIIIDFNVYSYYFKPINNKLYLNNNIKLYSNNNNDIEKNCLLSKIIYDYDFNNKNNIFKNNKHNLFFIPQTNKPNNITFDFIKNNNIYFNINQHASFLNNNNFGKNSEKYLIYLNNNFPNTEIYGYFNDKNRLHSLIFINHSLQEINIVFRGSQYFDEWIKNFITNEISISFKKEFKIHKGIYEIYTNDNIDNNIIYILKNLFDYFPKYRKIFTGHSRATIFCFLMVTELLEKVKNNYTYEIICFGNPQILNYNYAKYLHSHPNLKIYNIINQNDIISYLPLKKKYQIGLEILLTDKNICITKHKYPYHLRLNIFKLFNFISNHDLLNYIHKINKFTVLESSKL